MRALLLSTLWAVVVPLVSCSSEPPPARQQNAAGGVPAQGGNKGSGGSATGGFTLASGGSLPTGGASTGGSSVGGGGASAGGASSAGSGGTATVIGGFGGAPEDKPGTIEIGLRNNCPFPLWIHGQGNGGTLEPDDAELASGEIRWYDAPMSWSAARITAFSDGPRDNEIDKVEATFVNNGGDVVLNYNLTYVDWVGLPIEIEGIGTGGDCKKAGCYVPEATVLNGCPDGLLDGKKCQAARSYCLAGRNDGDEYCHRLDAEIQRCAQTKPGCEGASGAPTHEAYACSGFFGGSPKWCAAINRGMIDDPDNSTISAYYQHEPYNTYSKWVHEICPGIYAFPYDDYPPNAGESGFHACTGGQEMRVTFCPAG